MMGAATPEQRLAMTEADIQVETLKLERTKLKLERVKIWVTTIAVVLPILASLGTFLISRQQTLQQAQIDLEIKTAERDIVSKIEFLKLIADKPEKREVILSEWMRVFPDDTWIYQGDRINWGAGKASNSTLHTTGNGKPPTAH